MKYNKLIIFLGINFLALAIGAPHAMNGVASPWYQALQKAPWTPPGWVFAAAWNIIMLCFSVYMAFGWSQIKNRRGLIILYIGQWILNVAWNPVFFTMHLTLLGLALILTLTLVVIYTAFRFYPEMKNKTGWLVPYILWMLIATSLNAYIYAQN